MQLAVSNSTSNLRPENLPSVPSYKELLEARKKRLDERTKSAGALQLLKILEPSVSASKLPQMNQKFQQPAIIKKLNYDFGSLKEFLNYDLKLKRPEDMFKMDKNRRIEVKNKEEDLRKGLMQHVRQEIDTRSAKTILIEEKDPEKVSKAAKRFVSDMVSEIFQEDLNLLERKMHQKGVSKLYELLVGLEGDDPVRKVAEKYGYKTLPDKFKILEAEIEKRRILSESQALNAKKGSKGFGFQSKMSIYGMSPGLQEDSLMQSPLEIGSHGSYKRTSHRTPVPVLAHHPEVYMSRQSSIDMGKNQLKKPHMFIEESGVAYVARKDARSMSPKLKQKKDTDEERMAYIVKFIKSSAILEQVYAEYDKAEKEQFNKELKQAEENAKASYRDYYGLKSDERISAITKNHILFTHSELKPNFVMHTMFQFQTFSSLWILNLRGCGLQENILWLMLKVIERYSPDVRMIDISENEASERVCEVVRDILKKTELKVLRMANMGLKSKGLAIVCLGLAESPAITELDFNYNDIDEYGFKTLALILRHCRTLQTVKILRKKKVIVNHATGEEKLVEEELGYQAMAALTKAFKHNKYINPKNVLLFEAKSAY